MTLCELQLTAMISDLERSTGNVNAAAARLVRHGMNAADTGQRHADHARPLHIDAGIIVQGLQFHDELAQRLSHILVLLQLIREGTEVKQPEPEPAALLARLACLFSSQAEFAQLARVFPGWQGAAAPEAVELFQNPGAAGT
jgi:hypothetical protein